MRRTEFEGYPLRVEYELMPSGQRLVPLIDALAEWWEANTGEEERSPSTLARGAGSGEEAGAGSRLL